MKENYTDLYPNAQVTQKVGDYAYSHSTKLPKHITDYHAWGVETQEQSYFMISPFQAKFQIWTAKSIGAKRILEIGTFIGFSSMGWSEAVGPTGHVTTLEFAPEHAKLAEESFGKNGINNVEVIVGDARESIKNLAQTLKEPYDLIFIDADKTSYPTYLSQILSYSQPGSSTRLLRPGGMILADNILRQALVVDTSDLNPSAAAERERFGELREEDLKAFREFNDLMVESERVETFLMPLFDGLGMGRLVD